MAKAAAGGRPEPMSRDAEDRKCAQGQDHRLADEEHGGAGQEPGRGDEEVHDRGEVIAPRVHLGQAHVGAVAPGQVPGELHVVAEVQRVSAEGQVPGDRDEGKYRRVECDADGDDPPRVELGHPDRGNQKPERDGSEQHQEDVFGPGPERGRPARPEEKGARQPDASAHRRQVEQASRGQALAGTGCFLMRHIIGRVMRTSAKENTSGSGLRRERSSIGPHRC